MLSDKLKCILEMIVGDAEEECDKCDEKKR